MSHLFVSFVVFLSIALALAFGVGLSHACVALLFRLMGHRPETQNSAAVMETAHVSGD